MKGRHGDWGFWTLCRRLGFLPYILTTNPQWILQPEDVERVRAELTALETERERATGPIQRSLTLKLNRQKHWSGHILAARFSVN